MEKSIHPGKDSFARFEWMHHVDDPDLFHYFRGPEIIHGTARPSPQFNPLASRNTPSYKPLDAIGISKQVSLSLSLSLSHYENHKQM